MHTGGARRTHPGPRFPQVRTRTQLPGACPGSGPHEHPGRRPGKAASGPALGCESWGRVWAGPWPWLPPATASLPGAEGQAAPARCSEIPIFKMLTKKTPQKDHFKIKANAGDVRHVNATSVTASAGPCSQFRRAPAALSARCNQGALLAPHPRHSSQNAHRCSSSREDEPFKRHFFCLKLYLK